MSQTHSRGMEPHLSGWSSIACLCFWKLMCCLIQWMRERVPRLCTLSHPNLRQCCWGIPCWLSFLFLKKSRFLTPDSPPWCGGSYTEVLRLLMCPQYRPFPVMNIGGHEEDVPGHEYLPPHDYIVPWAVYSLHWGLGHQKLYKPACHLGIVFAHCLLTGMEKALFYFRH